MTHTGPLGIPRPGIVCRPKIIFELEGPRDVDTSGLATSIDGTIRTQEGLRPGTIDLIITTGDATIENETFNDIRDAVTVEISMTHNVTGWRIGQV